MAKPSPRIIGKERTEPDMQLIASALIDLVLREQDREIELEQEHRHDG